MKKIYLVIIITLMVAGCASTPNVDNRIPVEFAFCESKPSPGLTPQKIAGSEEKVYLHALTVLSTAHIAFADVVKSPFDGSQINIMFTKEGSFIFADLTKNNIGKRLAIIIEGEIIIAPVILTEITGGNVVITGSFTQEEAQRIASGIMGK